MCCSRLCFIQGVTLCHCDVEVPLTGLYRRVESLLAFIYRCLYPLSDSVEMLALIFQRLSLLLILLVPLMHDRQQFDHQECANYQHPECLMRATHFSMKAHSRRYHCENGNSDTGWGQLPKDGEAEKCARNERAYRLSSDERALPWLCEPRANRTKESRSKDSLQGSHSRNALTGRHLAPRRLSVANGIIRVSGRVRGETPRSRVWSGLSAAR